MTANKGQYKAGILSLEAGRGSEEITWEPTSTGGRGLCVSESLRRYMYLIM